MTKHKVIEFEENENNCYICTSHSKDKDGYIVYRKNNKMGKMHRHIYEECYGEIPKGMVVRHKCDNPSCINPEHLEIGTQKENVHDALKRGRRTIKLTQKCVDDIKQKFKKGNCTQTSLAKEYNVSQGTISLIVRDMIHKIR